MHYVGMRKVQLIEMSRLHREQHHDRTMPAYMCKECPENQAIQNRAADMILRLERPWWVPLWWPLR